MRRLLIRPGALGDCILSFPALEHLVTDYTEIWAPSAVIPLIHFASSVRSLVSTGINLLGVGDLALAHDLRKELESFDSIVSWYGSNREEFRGALSAINPNCEFHGALPPDDYAGHATDFFAQQVGAPVGLSPRIRIARTEQREAIVIHPFSGSEQKNWPLDRYRDLAARLPFEVDLIAGPEECLPDAHRFDNLADLGGFIAGVRVYIGNDSGITHLAAAVGVKTLAIFGPKSPRRWIPRGENAQVIAVDDLTALNVATVAHAANRLLCSR